MSYVRVPECCWSITLPPSNERNGYVTGFWAAFRAVPKVATVAGHPTPAVKTPSGCTHRSGTPVLVFMAPFLLVGGGLLAHYLLGRRRAK